MAYKFNPFTGTFDEASSTQAAALLEEVDVVTTPPATGKLLKYTNNSKWEPGNTTLEELTDTSVATPAQGSSLVYIDGAWRGGPVLGPKDPNVDLYYDNVTLLLSGTGTNGDTFLTDYSKTNYGGLDQRYGVPIISSDTAQFGSTSIRFGYNGYTATNNAFATVTNADISSILPIGLDDDFTIEFWVYFNFPETVGSYTNGYLWYVDGPTPPAGVLVDFGVQWERSAGSSSFTVKTRKSSGVSDGVSIPNYEWHHIAVVRSAGNTSLYADGSRIATNGFWNGAVPQTARMILGGGPSNFSTVYQIGSSYNSSFQGYIQDFRVTAGVARYTGVSFTLPTEPYPVSGSNNPRLLYPINYHDDVASTAPVDNQALVWNQSISKWEPANVALTNPSGITGASTITNIVQLSQANYDAIVTPDPNTLYVIV